MGSLMGCNLTKDNFTLETEKRNDKSPNRRKSGKRKNSVKEIKIMNEIVPEPESDEFPEVFLENMDEPEPTVEL